MKTPNARFQDASLAWSFADRGLKPQLVILGDDERYWVVSMAEGESLLRAGHEAAERF